MSETEAGGSVDRDDEHEVPSADEVLTSENGVDDAAEAARTPDESSPTD
jgi:hypothetical protein